MTYAEILQSVTAYVLAGDWRSVLSLLDYQNAIEVEVVEGGNEPSFPDEQIPTLQNLFQSYVDLQAAVREAVEGGDVGDVMTYFTVLNSLNHQTGVEWERLADAQAAWLQLFTNNGYADPDELRADAYRDLIEYYLLETPTYYEVLDVPEVIGDPDSGEVIGDPDSGEVFGF